MKEKLLFILDIKKDIKLNTYSNYFIQLNTGIANVSDSKKILLSTFHNKFYKKFIDRISDEFLKKIYELKKKIYYAPELEIFNLRHDKIKNLDLIINHLIIIEIIRIYDFKQIVIITDNFLTKEFYNANNYNRKIKIYYKGQSPFLNFVLLKIIKFYIKAFIVVLFVKFLKKNIFFRKINSVALSLYPIFYKENKEFFFKSNNKFKLNFLLTDESHLGLSLKKILLLIFKLNIKKFIYIEKYIKIKDLFLSLKDSIKKLNYIKRSDFNIKINDVDISAFYKNYLILSYINRSKIEIYKNAIIYFFSKHKIKEFHYYLFEYNFGFFLTRVLRENLTGIKTIGYQHGIFSDNIFWLNVISKLENSSYFPNTIYAFNKQNQKFYKEKLKNFKIIYKLRKKKLSNLSRELKFNNKLLQERILILTGTHDASHIYDIVKKKLLTGDKKKYYIKFHPKVNFNYKAIKNLEVIHSIKNISFTKVFVSPTSTLLFDFINLKKKIYILNINYFFNITPSYYKKYIQSF
jgi:hypothetical protein